jgi:hypothetical protein
LTSNRKNICEKELQELQKEEVTGVAGVAELRGCPVGLDRPGVGYEQLGDFFQKRFYLCGGP